MKNSRPTMLPVILLLFLFHETTVASAIWKIPVDESYDDYANGAQKSNVNIQTSSFDKSSWNRVCILTQCSWAKDIFQLEECIEEKCHAVLPEHRNLMQTLHHCGLLCRLKASSSASANNDVIMRGFNHGRRLPLSASSEWQSYSKWLSNCFLSCKSFAQLIPSISFDSCVQHQCIHQTSSTESDNTQINAEVGDGLLMVRPTIDDNSEQLPMEESDNKMKMEEVETEEPRAAAEVLDLHHAWKRYGMRVCAEAVCKSHKGYELVACGLYYCHGKW